MNRQSLRRSQSAKYRAPSNKLSIIHNDFNGNTSSSLPEQFISSVRQLFSILDKKKSGYVPFDVFKRYFDSSSTSPYFLNQLELESNANNHLITFNLLIKVIEQSLLSAKHSSANLTSKNKRRLNRSTSVFVVSPLEEKFKRSNPTINQDSNGLQVNNLRALNPSYLRNNVQRNNGIDFCTIRSLKQFEIERNLLIETCDILDRVKLYLTDCLYEMKDKQKSYCRYLTTAETLGVEPESMYNRDLVADLFKLANIVIQEVNYDLKKLPDHSLNTNSLSFYGINKQYEKNLKAKDDYIKQLQIENRILVAELIEKKHQQRTIMPIKIS